MLPLGVIICMHSSNYYADDTQLYERVVVLLMLYILPVEYSMHYSQVSKKTQELVHNVALADRQFQKKRANKRTNHLYRAELSAENNAADCRYNDNNHKIDFLA